MIDALYILAPDVKYRREWFGGIIYSDSSKATKFFNHTAALVIEQFAKPNSFVLAQRAVDQVFCTPCDHSSFFASLENEKIIRPVKFDSEAVGDFFFTDIYEFVDNRLYAPLGVEIELTLKCMRRCSYCAYESSPEIDTIGQLNRDEYRILLGELRKAGVFYIRFTGGDPLTRVDCLDIISDANNLGFAVALASDLTILKEEHARKLSLLKNLTALQTTLDGSTPEIANALRGDGNFQRVTQGISLLCKSGVPVIVGTVLTKLNVDNIYDIAKFLSKWDIAYCVSPLYDAGRGRTQRELIPTDDDLASAYEQFAKAVSEGLVRPADPGWRAIAEGIPSDVRSELWRGQPWLVRSPDRLMRIDPLGKCYTSIHLKEVLGDDIYVGKLPEDNILSLWNSAPLLNKLRAAREQNQYYGDVIDIRRFSKKIER